MLAGFNRYAGMTAIPRPFREERSQQVVRAQCGLGCTPGWHQGEPIPVVEDGLEINRPAIQKSRLDFIGRYSQPGNETLDVFSLHDLVADSPSMVTHTLFSEVAEALKTDFHRKPSVLQPNPPIAADLAYSSDASMGRSSLHSIITP
jgi:hypothetical protein